MCYGYKMRSILLALPWKHLVIAHCACLPIQKQGQHRSLPHHPIWHHQGRRTVGQNQIPLLLLHRRLPLSTSASVPRGGMNNFQYCRWTVRIGWVNYIWMYIWVLLIALKVKPQVIRTWLQSRSESMQAFQAPSFNAAATSSLLVSEFNFSQKLFSATET